MASTVNYKAKQGDSVTSIAAAVSVPLPPTESGSMAALFC